MLAEGLPAGPLLCLEKLKGSLSKGTRLARPFELSREPTPGSCQVPQKQWNLCRCASIWGLGHLMTLLCKRAGAGPRLQLPYSEPPPPRPPPEREVIRPRPRVLSFVSGWSAGADANALLLPSGQPPGEEGRRSELEDCWGRGDLQECLEAGERGVVTD